MFTKTIRSFAREIFGNDLLWMGMQSAAMVAAPAVYAISFGATTAQFEAEGAVIIVSQPTRDLALAIGSQGNRALNDIRAESTRVALPDLSTVSVEPGQTVASAN